MAVRMQASTLGIPVEVVTTSVQLERSKPNTAVFNYRVEIAGNISVEGRRLLDEAARTCPVRETLSKGLAFLHVPDHADLPQKT
jgi:uncharacterized OsmC-like protein